MWIDSNCNYVHNLTRKKFFSLMISCICHFHWSLVACCFVGSITHLIVHRVVFHSSLSCANTLNTKNDCFQSVKTQLRDLISLTRWLLCILLPLLAAVHAISEMYLHNERNFVLKTNVSNWLNETRWHIKFNFCSCRCLWSRPFNLQSRRRSWWCFRLWTMSKGKGERTDFMNSHRRFTRQSAKNSFVSARSLVDLFFVDSSFFVFCLLFVLSSSSYQKQFLVLLLIE